MADPKPRGRPRAFHDKTEQNTIQSLDRAMMVLEALSERDGATLSALAEALDQSPATVYRILTTLQQRGITEIDAGAQTWHVGHRAFLIGSSFLRRTSLIERSRSVMRDLMNRTGETANLGIEKSGEVLFVSQVETHASIRAFFPPGSTSPMHASGIGKALLAHLPDEQLARVAAATTREGFTPHTICSAAALADELQLIRSRGFSVDNEERTIGMRCIAAPIFGLHDEAVAGISVSGPVSRVTPEDVPRLGALVSAAARQLSFGMGGRRGAESAL